MFDLTTDRFREVRFALGLLIMPAIALGLAEGASRLILGQLDKDVVDWSAMADEIGLPSDDRLYLFRPNAEFENIATNALGLRGPNLQVPKGDDVLRIAFLGDSVTLGAAVRQEDTYPSLTTAMIDAELAGCNVDYLTFAGPGYTGSFISNHWPELAEQTDPDIVIALLGGPSEVLSRLEGEQLVVDPLMAGFAFWELSTRVQQRFSFSNLLPAQPRHNGQTTQIEPIIDEVVAELMSLSTDASMLFVGHRGQIRQGQPNGNPARFTANLNGRIPNGSGLSASALTELVLDTARQSAEQRGFSYSDAQNRIPRGETHYADPLHLTAEGHRALAVALMEDLLPLLSECETK